MKAENYFGMYIEQKVKVLRPRYKEQLSLAYTLMGVNSRNRGEAELFFEGHLPKYPISDCQLILKPLDKMSA